MLVNRCRYFYKRDKIVKEEKVIFVIICIWYDYLNREFKGIIYKIVRINIEFYYNDWI